MPTERGSPTANTVAGKLYVIGGDSYDKSLATVEEYDPVIRNWTILSDMSTSRHHAASAVIAG
jgi:hypothetical protein